MDLEIRPIRFADNDSLKLNADVDNKLTKFERLQAEIRFMTLENILTIQEKDFDENPDYKVYWQEATRHYLNMRANYKKRPSLHQKSPKEYHIALICYTDEIYREFNDLTRGFMANIENNVNFPVGYKSMFYLLVKATESVNAGSLAPDQVLYFGRRRGSSYDVQVGDEISFPQFLSTTIYADVIDLARKDGKPWYSFEIRNLRDNMLTLMMQHSIYPEEGEVLVWPFETFKCEGRVELSDGEIRIVLNAEY